MQTARVTTLTFQSSSQAIKDLFPDVVQTELDWTTLEGLMYQYWRSDMVTAERKRIRQTWFDYRHMHPVLRSYVFMHEYNKAHQRAYLKYHGTPTKNGSDLPRYSHNDLYRRNATTLVSVITRMHIIDELGCPYDSYFDAAFEHFMQHQGFDEWKQGIPHFADMPLPPISILANAHAMISSQRQFETTNLYRMRIPAHPHYKAVNWVGTFNQKDCAKWLIKQVQNRPLRDTTLARMCYQAGLLREAEVVKYLSIDTVKEMRHINKTVLSHE